MLVRSLPTPRCDTSCAVSYGPKLPPATRAAGAPDSDTIEFLRSYERKLRDHVVRANAWGRVDEDVSQFDLGALKRLPGVSVRLINELDEMKKKDPKRFAALKRRTELAGILHIERFGSVAQIERVLADRRVIKGDSRPVILVVGMRYDNSGAMRQTGNELIEPFMDDARIVYVEMGSETQFKNWLQSFEQKVKFSSVAITGHGNGTGMRFSKNETLPTDAQRIDLDDQDLFEALADRMRADATLLLRGCDSADLAHHMAATTKRTTIGSKGFVGKVKVTTDEGKIEAARFTYNSEVVGVHVAR